MPVFCHILPTRIWICVILWNRLSVFHYIIYPDQQKSKARVFTFVSPSYQIWRWQLCPSDMATQYTISPGSSFLLCLLTQALNKPPSEHKTRKLFLRTFSSFPFASVFCHLPIYLLLFLHLFPHTWLSDYQYIKDVPRPSAWASAGDAEVRV